MATSTPIPRKTLIDIKADAAKRKLETMKKTALAKIQTQSRK